MISEDFVHEAMERTQMAPWTFGAQLTDLDELLESERRFDYQFLNGAEYVNIASLSIMTQYSADQAKP